MATSEPRARSEETKTDLIRVRVTQQQRLELMRAAMDAGLDLSSWLRTLALAAAKRRRAK